MTMRIPRSDRNRWAKSASGAGRIARFLEPGRSRARGVEATSACRAWGIVGLSAVLLLVGGCGPYARRGGYAPRPAALAFDLPGKGPSPEARALVSVLGVRRELSARPHRRGLVLAIRIENLGEKRLRFDPASLVVLDANLEPLAGPIGSAEPAAVAPGEQVRHAFTFLLSRKTPLGGESLAGLNVRVTVAIGGRELTRSLSLVRRERAESGAYAPRGSHGGLQIGIGHAW